ncbi:MULTISPECIES: transketolase [Cobetia]|jgi:transketolase|uniref:Transketolase n=2 Tax=Halomonadaceae TaxID=28256 RepID=A0AAP4U0F0_9GAMM|nr:MULTISPECIES: transketolase [Cobetia]AVV34224.1 transketolase [Halomonas sp. SF2003]MBR9755208.1 transketolase [Gammaproteobacteria bacterium]TCJ24415.1 transketolase [Halomonas sp. GDM18]KGA01298.1 transketolase [Cobetia amphilecti]MBE2169328.1 transketolase [Cobetia sp. 2AS1]|tara:strand:- start:94027 stop:96021 length:1995 start_codon:yes stop_codon:yes gene_type:complete
MPSRFDLANAIRALSMDAVQKAKSGHPGAPMGMADIAEVLWNDHLKHNPANPNWADRDRFVLSNGHGSMLLYSLLHLSGYQLSLEDLQNFRQLHAKTAGHPEYGYAPGIETTTGPLGQGLANAVGMAIAEKTLAAQFNRPGHTVVDHTTWCFLGDGCMMEGISHEVGSLAGTLGLGKLIALYDDNGISIDGEVEGWFTDDTAKRFESYGWHVVSNVDGHKPEEINAAIALAKSHDDKPSLIICKTVIGFGSPNKEGTESCHGAPLGDDEVAATREKLGWTHAPFHVPEDIYQGWDASERGAKLESDWDARFARYAEAHPELAAEFTRRLEGKLPHALTSEKMIEDAQAAGDSPASRKASFECLNQLGPQLPELLGGSADLAPSNLTFWKGAQAITREDFSGNYLHYGVREFGMGAIMNGAGLHGGFIPYGATFLIFMEYMRNAVRMAALMGQQAVYVFTHDSIGLGEDGPTHQPIEQLTSLRTTPNLSTWRPADAVETAAAWDAAIKRHSGPTALILSRQNLPHQNRDKAQLANISRGGYVLKDAANGQPEVILIATGSEVGLAMDAAAELEAAGRAVRVVSMPATDLFDAQDAEYRESVLPSSVTARVAIEAGHRDYWFKYVGLNGDIIGMETFGESAPAGDLFKHFGFTVENVVERANKLLG